MALSRGDVPTPAIFLSPIVVAKLQFFCAKFIISSHLATMAIGSANPDGWMDGWGNTFSFFFMVTHQTFLCVTIKNLKEWYFLKKTIFLDENKPQNCLYLYFSAFWSHMVFHIILYLCKNILLHIVCYSAFFQEFKNL